MKKTSLSQSGASSGGPCGLSTPCGQRKFVLPGERPTLALLTIAAARAHLPGHDEDDIVSLIEEGKLLYAWDIGLGAAREIRILPDCVDHYARTFGRQPYRQTDAQVWATLCSAIHVSAPCVGDPARGRASTGGPCGPSTFVTSRALSLLLCCGSTHILNLIRAKSLSIVPGTTWSTGQHGAALITLQSLQTFFETTRQ